MLHRNTLPFFHNPWEALSLAAQAALTALWERRLISSTCSDLLHHVCLALPCCFVLHRNTLAFFHNPWEALSLAAQAALTALRARRLISFTGSKAGKPSYWKLTPLGKAVVASAMDPGTGTDMHPYCRCKIVADLAACSCVLLLPARPRCPCTHGFACNLARQVVLCWGAGGVRGTLSLGSFCS